jgi:hypothetical protein
MWKAGLRTVNGIAEIKLAVITNGVEHDPAITALSKFPKKPVGA